jgi:hypothetical protein
MVRWRGDEE